MKSMLAVGAHTAYRQVIDFGRTSGPLRHGTASHAFKQPSNFDSQSRFALPNGIWNDDKLGKGQSMESGTVKFYNDQKGYGFIAPDNGGKDVFVHATALERAGLHGLSEGQKVSFDTEVDQRSGKTAVANIQAG
jgi:cold shock protein